MNVTAKKSPGIIDIAQITKNHVTSDLHKYATSPSPTLPPPPHTHTQVISSAKMTRDVWWTLDARHLPHPPPPVSHHS